MSKAIPSWLQPNMPVYHIPSCTVFIASRLVRNATGHLSLIDAPKPLKGSEYPLDECRKPTLQDFNAALLVSAGEALTVIATDRLLIVTDGKKQVGVHLPKPESNEVLEAAQSLAKAFDGAIAYGVEVPDADGT